MRGSYALIAAAVPLIFATGCVRRTILITSEPDGALVWLNDQEVGRTPVEVDFIFYGEYDVRIEKDGYEPIMTGERASPPLWDNIPIDLVAEAVPTELHAQMHWHYELTPPNDDHDDMLNRANDLRERIAVEDEEEDEASDELRTTSDE